MVVSDQPTDPSDEPRSGDEPRRRRGTRGGRGRGGSRAEPHPEEETTRVNVTGNDEPRIVGRRPGRTPAAAPATEEATPEPARRATSTRSAVSASASASSSASTETPTGSRTNRELQSGRTAQPSRPVEAAPVAAEPAPAARTRRASTPAAAAADPGQLAELLAVVQEQNRQLVELQRELRALGEQVERSARRARLGIFVDVPNLLYGTDRQLDMGKLLDYLADGRDVVRATAYAPVSDNPMEPVQQQRFVAPFVPFEYRIVTKPLKRFADGSIKGNFDVEMAVDLLTMADRLDVIAIVSGDADFAGVVEEVQSKGVRVEVVAFAGSTSAEMRSLADRYIEVGSIINQLLFR